MCRFKSILPFLSAILICLTLFSCSAASSKLSFTFNNSEYKLLALNKNAVNSVIKTGGVNSYLYYKFSDELNSALQKSGYLNDAGVPSSLKLSFLPAEQKSSEKSVPGVVTVAFLYEDDFQDGKLKAKLPARAMARFAFEENKRTDVSFAFPYGAGKKLPAGFLVLSAVPLTVARCSFSDYFIGWKDTPGCTSYGFSENGGSYTDFSGAPLSINNANSAFDNEPYLYLHFRDDASDMGVNGAQNKVTVKIGDRTVSVFRSPAQKYVSFYVPRVFCSDADCKNQFLGKVDFSVISNAEMLTGIEYAFVSKRKDTFRCNPAKIYPTPISADAGLLIKWSSKLWRNPDYEVFSWEQFPSVLIIDTADYGVQDQLVKRLAFFVEKAGFRGRLVEDEEVRDLHGYNAHDYRPESLAAFFDTAEKQGFNLNRKEIELREILEREKIIVRSADGWLAGNGGLLTFSKSTNDSLRTTLLTHESLHGIYFITPEFRNIVSQVYTRMDRLSLEFLQQYFVSQPTLNYDLEDSYLMENEMMAYLLQQPLKDTAKYFAKNLAVRGTVNKAIPELAAYVRETEGAGFVNAAAILDEYMFRRWGINAGRTFLVSVK